MVQVRTRHTPAFGVARLLLAPGEAALAEFGAMLATSFNVVIDVRARTGSRSKARDAVFTAPAEGGWVDLAPSLPGEVYTLELDGMSGWCVSRGSRLAIASTIHTDPSWPGLHQLFGAEQGFVEHVSGQGALVLACCGALDVVNLEQGEFVTVDPRYLLAYADTVQCRLRAVSQNGPQSVRTGDGLLLDFAGPGQVLTHTRNAAELAAALNRA
jgi:uncharacterized protein (AIM24 family)